MASRSYRILQQLLQWLSAQCQPELDRVPARLDAELARRAARERDFDLMDDWVASRQALELNGDRFVSTFLETLRQQCLDAFTHVAAPAMPHSPRLQPLRLLDERIVDEGSTLAGIAARVEALSSLPLLLLGHRFGVLLERPPLTAAELPVGPRGFGSALRQTGTALGLRLHARLAMYQMLEATLWDGYPKLAERMDAVVDQFGVLRGLSYVPLRRRHVPEHPARGQTREPGTDAAASGPLSETGALRVVNGLLDELAPSGLLPEQRLMERRIAVSGLVRLLTHHGEESAEWKQCVEVVREALAAARAGHAVAPATADWIR